MSVDTLIIESALVYLVLEHSAAPAPGGLLGTSGVVGGAFGIALGIRVLVGSVRLAKKHFQPIG